MTTSRDAAGGHTFQASAAGAACGAIVLIAGLFVAPAAVATSYLVAYAATLAVVLGMLLLVMIAHLSGAVWFVVLRRQAEAVLASLPVLAVLTIPLLVAPRAFWPWAAPFDSMSAALQDAVRVKATYLHPAFFALRAVIYWAAWLGFGEWLWRTSRRQDAAVRDVPASRFRFVSAAGIPIVALAQTFAAFDWMMSLSPAWTSSVYGMYVFAGSMVSALALVAVLARAARARDDRWTPTADHFQALGRLTLAFLLLWAYLWYVQFFIVWIADIPQEAAWYVVRLRGGWGALGTAIVIGGFVVPFLALVLRAARGSAIVMPALGVWLLAVHYLDVYWLMVPSVRVAWSITDLVWDAGALVFVAGSAAAFSLWRQASVPRVPTGDPLLEWSVRYEAH